MSVHGECFDTGMAGKCGLECQMFLCGECEHVDEAEPQQIIDQLGEEQAIEVMECYPCFNEFLKNFNKGKTMKNEDMKITELLNAKKNIEYKIQCVVNAISILNRDTDSGYQGSIIVKARTGSNSETILQKELLIPALEKQLKIFREELEPIESKLNAIELMLNA
jgi:ribosomal protein L19